MPEDPSSSPSSSSMASKGSHQRLYVGTTLKYNMTLENHMDNSLGAKIYVDPLGRFALRVNDHDIELYQEILVSLLIDSYMDLYQTIYLIIDELQRVNQWDWRGKGNMGKKPIE